MSRETLEWLNNNTLLGFMSDREKWADQPFAIKGRDADGNDQIRPWFAEEGYTGGFTGPVPVEAVMERLFHWEAIEAPLHGRVPGNLSDADGMDEQGNPYRSVQLPDHKAIMRSDTDTVLGVFKQGYTVHQYDEWLIENVAAILDDDVQIDSAGLLMGGGVAWVSVSLPETFTGSVDFEVRPRILAFTSHNGKHSTTYQRSVNAPVCDNSLDIEISLGRKHGQQVKIKHSSRSMGRITDAREALGILYSDAEQMVQFFDKLADWKVSKGEYMEVLNFLVPIPEAEITVGADGKQKVKNQRGITIAQNKQMEVTTMYAKDFRAAPWNGTGLGVLQAFNTWDQQVRAVQGERVERQMLSTLDGSVGKFDHSVLEALEVATGQKVGELLAV